MTCEKAHPDTSVIQEGGEGGAKANDITDHKATDTRKSQKAAVIGKNNEKITHR